MLTRTNQVIRHITAPGKYYFAKARVFLAFHLSSFNRREAVLIYQMGKVGSSSIYRSLKKMKMNMPVYHVHTLTSKGMADRERIYRTSRKPYRPRRHLWESRYLSRQVERGGRDRKWKIITLIREPIARDISNFFQLLNLWLPDTEEVAESHERILENLFHEKYLSENNALEWFDEELKAVFGIDVYSTEFPKSTGYKIYRSENVDVLLIKLEKLNECAQDAFREFLNISKFTLLKDNMASKKRYAGIYREFERDMVLPAAYIRKSYESRYMRHFYSQEEIEAFEQKWHKAQIPL